MEMTRLANESREYRAAREELQLAEIDLMRQRERVAELRRRLPTGAVVDDYVFEEGPADLDAGDEPVRQVRLSELFSGPDRPLIVYQFMYGKAQRSPCPMCTMWIDGFNAVVDHVSQNADFVVVAAADVPTLRFHARARGWDRLRLLSAGAGTFKYDLASEDEAGAQESTISVFTRDADGTVRHFYTSHPWMSAGIRERGVDLHSPVWHLLDLTPAGRGGWYPELRYER
ncbi:thioredoxin family protein [Dactylosporangium darangshiense]|uniref:Thioredoxin family protein n=2 Tax=Dactylosporangium darangshiense TaxID=579108 RepID=A0ABP8CT59_9ACTN